ncbi:Ent-kaurene oxidase [Daldinia childiae]|uniref:Ent-kaurene oxidase n=1 Tax=Daldinia childiae TaxID=326645 RepID=UPI001444BEFD|nr:Ent-kaurene oxidase [Daldinia childiae]KAF3069057.1 Ent-kaurene oxidase [Daldinia childiae]
MKKAVLIVTPIDVLLPASEFKWLVNQPESDVGYHVDDEDQLEHILFLNQHLLRTILRNRLISTVLTRETYNLVPALLGEIRYTVDNLLGTDTENFHEICARSTIQNVSCRVMNRVFVGRSISRNAKFSNAVTAYIRNTPTVSRLLRFIWKPLRPLAALFLTLPARIRTWKIYDILGLEIERRLKVAEANGIEPELKATENDLLQWMVDGIKLSNDPRRFKFNMLFGSILTFNFAAMTTVSSSMTHAIVDLACSKKEYLGELRVEISSVIAKHGGKFDKRALASMVKLDSLMRESQRINTPVTVSIPRSVVKKGGIKTPSGIHVPQGAVMVVPTYSIMRDAAIYPDPCTFKPFRFAGEPTAPGLEGQNGNAQGSLPPPTNPPQPWVKATPEYTAFGYGPHACPGRHIAAVGVKLMMAYIIAHYDFETEEKRPENIWIGHSQVGPQKTTVRIRRRKEKDVVFA